MGFRQLENSSHTSWSDASSALPLTMIHLRCTRRWNICRPSQSPRFWDFASAFGITALRYHGTGGADTSKWEWAGGSVWSFLLWIHHPMTWIWRPPISTEIRWLPMLATTPDWRWGPQTSRWQYCMFQYCRFAYLRVNMSHLPMSYLSTYLLYACADRDRGRHWVRALTHAVIHTHKHVHNWT